MTQRIVMIGTGGREQGGVASVVRFFWHSGFAREQGLEMVQTHTRDRWLRLPLFAWALARLLGGLLGRRWVGAHVHLSVRGSCLRKRVVCRLLRVFGLPYLLHLHSGEFADYVAAQPPRRQAAIRRLLGGACAVVVVAESWKDWRHSAGLPMPGVCLIPNTVEPSPPLAQPVARRQDRLLFLGQLSEGKGLPELLSALALLAPAHPRLRLWLAGDGDPAPWRELAARLGVLDRLDVLGWVAGADKTRLLAEAAALVLPSRAEGQPISVLEALAQGTPVVASAVGGIPELITDGEQGLLVPPRDARALAGALDALLRDPAAAERRARQGRQRFEQVYAPAAVLARWRALYVRLGWRAPTAGESAPTQEGH
ncbi:glycosyltransferase family 4 protein [Pelomonas sp. CA6]|uniref:glycosyltransferase family 4 protein n=1 Tax=Pelomonas sp. CA6 TaxID=2907999 RepID=UPI001F4C0D18|nr:glycosyltransferase family 4 protein [Pelomonas sp. CA6]MCH7343708.1 glycosyltransferase family 4 protein [Pelomonas sp. CA6]